MQVGDHKRLISLVHVAHYLAQRVKKYQHTHYPINRDMISIYINDSL